MSVRSLLQLDPQLGALVPSERLAAAHAQLAVRVVRQAAGGWDTEPIVATAGAEHVGVLVLDGVVAHEVQMAGIASTELLGPGDLLRPWALEPPPPLLRREVRWRLLSETRLAVLDRDFGRRLGAWPEVNAALMDRLAERAERLAATQAISQLTRVDRRVLAFFWHTAERWGRVTPEGVLVPLTLSHRMLGQLIGARRPTVTTAVCALAEAGELVRRGDGSWLLGERPDSARLDGDAEELPPPRRRLLLTQATARSGTGAAAAR